MTRHPIDDHDLGLAHDLPRLLGRRRALGLFAAGSAGLALAACGGSDDPTGASTSSTAADSSTSSSSTAAGSSGSGSTATSASAAGTTAIPQETGGPFPADGTNGPNVLTQSGVVRQDITKSFGSLSGTAAGVPLTVSLKLLNLANGGAPRAGAAVYLWHCTLDGDYSLYTDTSQNYLRGVQEADDDGVVTFKTIYPGCYSGRWPHMHFEIFDSLSNATSAGQKLRTTQLALPEDACREVYATDGYESSVSNLSRVSLASDNVFSDGYAAELATVAGSVSGGLTASLNVGI